MAEWVLDSSAVLASVRSEPGGEVAGAAFSSSLITAVNVAEVASRLVDLGYSETNVARAVGLTDYMVIDFDPSLAIRAGLLRTMTRRLGLSLGDRACLALAEREGLPVLTADRAWADLDIGIEIRLIR